MSYVGKCYRVLEDDEETMMQWPEIKTGFEFQVLRADGVGATRIRSLDTNKIFDIEYPLEARNPDYDDTHSWFWCVIHMTDSDIEEIESVDLPEEDPTSTGKIRLNHFHGREVDIAYALTALASQENCDGEEHHLMMVAADYIRQLENNQK